MAFPIFAIAGAALVGGATSILAFGPGVGDLFTQQVNTLFQARIANIAELVNAYRRGDLKEDEFKRLMKLQGLGESQIEITLQGTQNPLSLNDILTLWFRFRDHPERGFSVNEQWLSKQFKRIAVAPSDQKEMIEASRPVPTLDDIIRFAVRDVFEPQVVQAGGLDQNVPQVFLKEAKQRGLTEQDAMYYWISHWNFPSLLQSFEMFHRLFDHPDPAVRFGRADMDALFNVHDIAPRMRSRLQAIAYRPIGRVDIRRFARLGVFGVGDERKAKLKRRYMELGFSPSDAEQQAAFTEKLVGRQSAPFTTAQILRNYRDGIPKDGTRDFAVDQLKRRGLNQDEIDTLLSIEDERNIDLEEQTQIDAVQSDFEQGRIVGDNALRDALAKIGLPTGIILKSFNRIKKSFESSRRHVTLSRADDLLQAGYITQQKWKQIYRASGIDEDEITATLKLVLREQSSVKRLPSKEDLLKFMEQGLIDSQLFTKTMKQIGYSSDWITVYIASVGGEELS